jgi:hypothetical protein
MVFDVGNLTTGDFHIKVATLPDNIIVVTSGLPGDYRTKQVILCV